MIEGKIERKFEMKARLEENVRSYWMTVRKLETAGIDRGSTGWQSVENVFRKSCGPVVRRLQNGGTPQDLT